MNMNDVWFPSRQSSGNASLTAHSIEGRDRRSKLSVEPGNCVVIFYQSLYFNTMCRQKIGL